MTFTPPPVGTFCWFEVATLDLGAAATFYGGLFGWTAEQVPSAEGTYQIWRHEGRQVGGAWVLPEALREQKVPPHWLPYAKVVNVEAAAKVVVNQGGQILHPPCDVMDLGRATVIQDPSGGVLALWQDGSHTGHETHGEPGSPCWVELTTRDPEGARGFYAPVLGWAAREDASMGFTYTHWQRNGQDIGGMMPMEGPEWEGVPTHWMTYFAVADCDASVEKAKDLGASICVPPTDIPTVGRFAVLADPMGATFSVIQLAPRP